MIPVRSIFLATAGATAKEITKTVETPPKANGQGFLS